MATAWDDDGIELLTKMVGGLETISDFLMGTEITATTAWSELTYATPGVRDGAKTTVARAYTWGGDGGTITQVTLALGHDTGIDHFEADELLCDASSLSVSAVPGEKAKTTASIEFKR